MKRKFILLSLLALILVGCGNNSSSSENSSQGSSSETSSGTNESSSSETSENSSSETSENSSSESSSEVPPTSQGAFRKVAQGENKDNRALDENSGLTALSSLGEQKILVVPVVFPDKTNKATSKYHEAIEKVFFGKSEETGWESVASFYEKSSFGRLTLSGEVTDYFYTDYTSAEFSEFAISETQEFGESDNYWDQTHYLIRDIYENLDAELLKEYDQDEDGHVDGLWMVYMNEYNTTDPGSPFWAYKFYWNQEANIDKPTPNTYAWASIDFASEGSGYFMSNNKYDAHTFIHETGHMFGLNDYYDYEGFSSPVGAIDMMDYNIIDHNVYSKYVLNWVEPYYVDGAADIYLHPAESSGDFILIKNNWNGHAYDNYLLLEYYTPTGLNEKDAIDGYGRSSSSALQGFTESGVRIWHVDSRLVRIEYADEEAEDYTYRWVDDIEDEDELSYTTIGPVNSTRNDDPELNRRIIDEDYRQLHLLDAAKRTGSSNWLHNGRKNADNKALFKENHIINAADWSSYFTAKAVTGDAPSTFNDETEVGYSIEIGVMNKSGVMIKIRPVE